MLFSLLNRAAMHEIPQRNDDGTEPEVKPAKLRSKVMQDIVGFAGIGN